MAKSTYTTVINIATPIYEAIPIVLRAISNSVNQLLWKNICHLFLVKKKNLPFVSVDPVWSVATGFEIDG
jgi:hypothetical protein